MNRTQPNVDAYAPVKATGPVQTELDIPLIELQAGDRALALVRLSLSQQLLISAAAANRNLLIDPHWQSLLEQSTAILNQQRKL